MTATAFFGRIRGDSLTSRAIRSTLLTVGGFGGAQLIRLASNLILTRLLFPEAFGLMALVLVFILGFAMFSDVGVTPAIMQSKRGDDQEFLDTAWTIQVIRGIGLFAVVTAAAWPLSIIYEEPQLFHILPVAALQLLFMGFNPTRLYTANRHLMLGRVTAIDFATQVMGVFVAILFAWLTGSVWALAVSAVVSAALQLLLYSLLLPGQRNRFRLEKPAARELVNFGKWIFLSTICGFLFTQGDKLLIGKFLPLDAFGIYNIGFYLASFPMLLGGMVTQKVLIPIYRETPPKESQANFLKLRKMRIYVTAALMALLAGFAGLGVWLVEMLYDPRYHMAGGVVVLLAVSQIPQIIALTYDQAALAAGDSRRFFVLALARATFMVGCLLIGLHYGGLFGGILAQGAAMTLVYPVVVWLSIRTGAWDPLHDFGFAILGFCITGAALWMNWAEVVALIPSAAAG